MTPRTESVMIRCLQTFMALVIVGFVGNFVYEAHKMFTKGDNVGGWMALGVAAVFVAIGVLGWLAQEDD